MADWSIKQTEIVDKHSGLTVEFGSNADGSNTVFLKLTFKNVGSLFTFQRDGELLKITPIALDTNAAGSEDQMSA